MRISSLAAEIFASTYETTCCALSFCAAVDGYGCFEHPENKAIAIAIATVMHVLVFILASIREKSSRHHFFFVSNIVHLLMLGLTVVFSVEIEGVFCYNQ